MKNIIPIKKSAATLNIALFFTLVILLLGGYENSAKAASSVHITEGDQWNYFTGTEGPPVQWTYVDFDDSKWLNGRSGFGYGIGSYRTLLGDMKGSYQTVYVRRDFMVNNPLNVTNISFSLICNGPFVAYINGREAIRNSEPVSIRIDLTGLAEVLHKGSNVLAVQCSNDDVTSDKFYFTPYFDVQEQ
ncbi:MAG: hypothetical protein HZB37_13920 [Planctomycetes bacterium]|nr:hypothetical protein [Planctomycetota bacterium]